MEEDPYDIIRDIHTDRQSDVVREIDRLWNRKRIGQVSHEIATH